MPFSRNACRGQNSAASVHIREGGKTQHPANGLGAVVIVYSTKESTVLFYTLYAQRTLCIPTGTLFPFPTCVAHLFPVSFGLLQRRTLDSHASVVDQHINWSKRVLHLLSSTRNKRKKDNTHLNTPTSNDKRNTTNSEAMSMTNDDGLLVSERGRDNYSARGGVDGAEFAPPPPPHTPCQLNSTHVVLINHSPCLAPVHGAHEKDMSQQKIPAMK